MSFDAWAVPPIPCSKLSLPQNRRRAARKVQHYRVSLNDFVSDRIEDVSNKSKRVGDCLGNPSGRRYGLQNKWKRLVASSRHEPWWYGELAGDIIGYMQSQDDIIIGLGP